MRSLHGDRDLETSFYNALVGLFVPPTDHLEPLEL